MEFEREIIRPSSAEIAKLIYSKVFRFSDERALQDKLETLFEERGIPYVREFSLTPKDRIDFMTGHIGIEVKVDSSTSTVLRQLFRYAGDLRVEELILVTTRSRHKELPREINGKPLIVVHLLASIF